MRSPTTLSAIVFLALLSLVTASPWLRRQETSSIESAAPTATEAETATPTAASTDAPEVTATGTQEPASTNGTAEGGSSTTNDTATATSNSTAAATSTASDPDTPEPSATCDKGEERTQNPDNPMPFCSPKDGQILVVGQSYPIDWDPKLFHDDALNTLELKYANDPTNGTDIWRQEVSNKEGHYEFTMYEEYLDHGSNGTNLTLYLVSNSSDVDSPKIRDGPVFSLITNSTDGQGSHKGGDSKVGEKAGIPVGLGVFLIAVAALIFWFWRKKRGAGKGYLANRSRRGTRMTGDTGDGGFRDEPTRGLELQNRNGHGRQDSWEAGWSENPPTEGGRNQFRDEIDRQRRR